MSAMFRSFSVFNYRVWFIGALVSNIGAWMQATAQNWVVLTELTDNDAAAMGVTMALQFAPPLLLVGVTGWVADRFDRRRLLMVTQGLLFLLAIGLGVMILTGPHDPHDHVRLRARTRRRVGLRQPGPTGVRLRRRHPRERVERGRAERGILQRRPDDRPRRRGPGHRRRRHRLGLPRQRRHVLRDGRRAPADPPARAAAPRRHVGRFAPGRRLPVRLAATRPHRDVRDGVPGRRVRHELPDLRVDDGARVRSGGRRIRPPQLDPRDRLARRRAPGRPPRPRPHPGGHRRHSALRGRRRRLLLHARLLGICRDAHVHRLRGRHDAHHRERLRADHDRSGPARAACSPCTWRS